MADREHDAFVRAYSTLGLGSVPKGALLKPSTALFHKVSFALAIEIDPEWGGTATDRRLLQGSFNDNYRKQFCQLIDSLHKRYPDMIKPITKSWLVQAGGAKVVRCLFQLSSVALFLSLQKKHRAHSIVVDRKDVFVESEPIVERSIAEIARINFYERKMRKLETLYRDLETEIESETDRKRQILNSIVKKLIEACPSDSAKIEKLLNPLAEAEILNEWKPVLNDKIENVSEKLKFLNERTGKFSEAIRKSKMVIKKRTEKHNNEFLLAFDPERDRISLPEEFCRELGVEKLCFVKNVICDNILNFPNLIRTFCIAVFVAFEGYRPVRDSISIVEAMNERISYFQMITEESAKIKYQLNQFIRELKDEDNPSLNVSHVSHKTFLTGRPRCDSHEPEQFSEDSVKYWDAIEKNLIFDYNEFPVKEVNGYAMSANVSQDLPKQTMPQIKITDIKLNVDDGKFKRPSFISNLEETRLAMSTFGDKTLNKTERFNSSRISMLNSAAKNKTCFSENHYLFKTLTSVKKSSSADKIEMKHSRKWTNLFEETLEISELDKNQSSTDPCPNSSSSTFKSDTQISGVKPMEYSSFLSGLESASDSSKGSSQFDQNKNNEFKTPPKIPKNIKTGRKSLDRVINTYKKFKETRLKNLNSTQIVQNYSSKKELSLDDEVSK